MSFGFSVIGTREEIREQLPFVAIYENSPEGKAVRDFLIDHFENYVNDPSGVPSDYDLKYLAEANGHTGTEGTTSININIRTVWAPRAKVSP